MAPTSKTPRKRATANAKPAPRRARATTRSAPSQTTARRTRAKAAGETRDAAQQTRKAAQAEVEAARVNAERGVERTRSLAERAALIYLGATLETRDRLVVAAGDFADRYGSRAGAGRELRTFERRGERDVRKVRTQVERSLRRNLQAIERDADR